jgi:hypothetical protein
VTGQSRYVRRGWQLQQRVVSVEGVQEEAVEQSEAGDFLYLKGHAWPGNQGAAAPCVTPGLNASWMEPSRVGAAG